MATGFGAEPTKNAAGAVTVGTTSADIRKIFGALYTPGLISGGAIKTSASTMTYNVAEGVASFKMANGESVLGYWPATSNLAPTSSTVPRKDYVYAVQRTPSVHGDSNIRVEVDSSFPATGAVLLGTFVYSAGATSSNAGVRSGAVDYSVPYGSSMGELSWMQNTHNGTFSDRQVIMSGQIQLPTDRLIMFNFSTVVSATGGGYWNPNTYTEASYHLKVDGVQVAKWQSPGLTVAWTTLNFEERKNLNAGSHTVTVDRGREVGPGVPYQHFIPNAARGAHFSITDMGVIR